MCQPGMGSHVYRYLALIKLFHGPSQHNPPYREIPATPKDGTLSSFYLVAIAVKIEL